MYLNCKACKQQFLQCRCNGTKRKSLHKQVKNICENEISDTVNKHRPNLLLNLHVLGLYLSKIGEIILDYHLYFVYTYTSYIMSRFL